MRSEDAMMLHRQIRSSFGGNEPSSEYVEKHHFSDKVNEGTDKFGLVQASGKLYFIPAHLVLLTSKMKTISC